MSQGGDETDIYVHALVGFNAENLNHATSQYGTSTPRAGRSNPQRSNPASTLKEGEVSLVLRSMNLTPDKVDDRKLLFEWIQCNSKNVRIEIPVEISFSTEDLMEVTPEVSSLQIFHEGDVISPLFTLSLNLSTISSEGRRDMVWAQEIRDQKQTTKGLECMAGLDYSYTLALDTEKIWLVLEITAPTTNAWSHRSLQRSGEIWYQLLAEAFPNGKPKVEKARTVTPRDFYISGHVPDKTKTVSDSVQHPVLSCELMPYQRRTIRWMLQRESMDIDEASSSIVPYNEEVSGDLPPTFFAATDKKGRECYVSHILGVISTNLSALYQATNTPRGGILAEEMGLGKTVELIALLSLNQMPTVSNNIDASVGATLIITPPSILDQWKKEIAAHAPGVKVFHYLGMKSHRNFTTEDLVREFNEHDVVLTTYTVLSAEIHYVQPHSGRKMRGTKKYIAKKSPLVEVCWWRLCLDEAQMIDGGYSNAAVVARTIPRVNAWAVTGTPIRKDINDLHGLLRFLNYEPFCGKDRALFNRLINFNHAAFGLLFKAITLRHTKDMVRDEIILPLQKRVIVTVPFSAVEEQNYRHLFEKMCADCGLNESGAPAVGDWSPDTETLDKMRTWLTRLRQTCLHPQAGEKNRKVFGVKGPLRTVEEVLHVMIDQQANNIRNDERSLFESMIKRGQLYEHLENFDSALNIWKTALEKVRGVVIECRDTLTQEITAQSKAPPGEAETGGFDRFAVDDDNDDNDEDDPDIKTGRIGTLKNRLRSFLDIEHACLFWVGTAYYNLKDKEEKKDPSSEKIAEFQRLEEDYYYRAKLIRKEIMHETRTKALKLINSLKNKAEKQKFVEIPDIDPPSGRGGIESRTHLDNICELTNALNEQVITLDKWRENLVQLLIKSMMDEDENENEELKGDEFEVSVMEQELSERYMTAIRGLIADREEALQGLPNALVKHDIQTDLSRAGSYQDFLRELIAKKEMLKPKKGLRFLRVHITELRGVVANLKARDQSGNSRARVEKALVEAELKRVQETMTSHTKINADLAREVEMMRNVTNARKDYYRQVQDISDTVAPFDLKEATGNSKVDDGLFKRIVREEENLAEKIREAKAKSRYLIHLRGQGKDESPECLICRDSYEMGILTSCGHEFCKDCMGIWYKTSHKCPACNLNLNFKDIFQISYKPKEATMQEERNSSGSETSRQSSPGIYADMDDRVLKEIKRIDLKSYFGSKIDMIVRHLLWLQKNERGFKAVIFSQWGDFLDFMKTVLTQANIGFATLEKKNGIEKFKTDPSCHCFFLHAKSQSAGLSLVNATHVFLCEPLINVSLELQAISRVHRIGQTRPTTVWLYVVNGTVEQSVLEMSTRRRMALMEQHSVPGEEGRKSKRSRASNSEELEETERLKRRKTPDSDGERLRRRDEEGGEGSREASTGSPKRKRESDDNGENREKRRSPEFSCSSPKTPISTDRQLDVANSLELQKGLRKLVEKSPGGGEMVGNEDLWACLFGVGKGNLPRKEVEVAVRREMLAGAAEARVAAGGSENT